MSEQEEDGFINDIWIEKQSLYDLEGKYGEDIYTLNFSFCLKTEVISELIFKDLENLHKLLGEVLAIERKHRALPTNPIEKTEK